MASGSPGAAWQRFNSKAGARNRAANHLRWRQDPLDVGALSPVFGVPLASLPGLDQVAVSLDQQCSPGFKGVLVGTAFNPSKTDTKPDGTEVHTLWGELAWQLGGASGYAEIAERTSVGPPRARAQHCLGPWPLLDPSG